MSTLEDKIAQLSPERRERVIARGQELIADEMTLRGTQPSLQRGIRYNLTPVIRVKVRILSGLRWEALSDE